MTRRPEPTLSPQARRQAHHQALLEALAQRDGQGMERLLGQWVHRYGHPSLAGLLLELQQADPGGMAWWQGGSEPPDERAPQPNPELARLRSWLPDRVERRRAA